MKKIAVLLTCFNRKEKTLSSLEHLHKALEQHTKEIVLQVYLTDDGSSDGTSEAVKDRFPGVRILKGSGDLYWSGGMRNSWKEAIKDTHDYYLLLNDDSNVMDNVFEQLFLAEEYCLKTFGKEGIYVGFTRDPITKDISYGAKVIVNRFLYKVHELVPTGTSQECVLGNANIMLVPKVVVDQIGVLSEGYIHAKGDYDYTLKARKHDIPVLTTGEFCGECTYDKVDIYAKYHMKSFKKRIEILYNPVGLDFRSNLTYMKSHFPFRLPFFYVTAWIKVIFPTVYTKVRSRL